MKLAFLSRWLSALIVYMAVCSSLTAVHAAADEETGGGVLESLKQSYDELPDAGKFATGAVAGFGVTRFTVNKVVSVVKIAGAVFIGSEALKYSGALERVSDENMDTAQQIKASVVNTVDKYRVSIRRRLHPDSIRDAFNDAVNKDKMATFGFATGCFVGCVL